MVAKAKIRDYAARVARTFRPDRIILFGSYAYGKPTEDSDVDILIVMPHAESGAVKASEIRLSEEPGFPTDLLVWSPELVERRKQLRDSFIIEIVEKGEVLYESSDSRVG
jgi:uncharacterized protein